MRTTDTVNSCVVPLIRDAVKSLEKARSTAEKSLAITEAHRENAIASPSPS